MALQGMGDLEVWYGERLMPAIGPRLAGDTGDFEAWAGERLMPDTYVTATAAPPAGGSRRRSSRFRFPLLDRFG